MPSRRQMDLTEELVALVDRRQPDPGPDPGTRAPQDADYEARARALLAEHDPEHLWIFAYGSLIWNPTFEALEHRRATVRGWHRAFCLRINRWRGSPAFPGLMLALDRGGGCVGVVYRLPQTDHLAATVELLKRELDAIPPTNTIRWLEVQTADGPVKALATVIDRRGPAYAGKLERAAAVRMLAFGAGHWGTTADYVRKTVAGLEAHGIHDRHLWDLQRQIAEEIRRNVQ